MSAQDVGVIIRTALTTDPTVTEVVAGRIFPEEAPEDEPLPLIVYAVRLNKGADGDAPIWDVTVDVHCYTADDDAAQALAVAADAVLSGMTWHSNGTWLKPLTLDGWDEARDADNNLWGRLLSYGGLVVRG